MKNLLQIALTACVFSAVLADDSEDVKDENPDRVRRSADDKKEAKDTGYGDDYDNDHYSISPFSLGGYGGHGGGYGLGLSPFTGFPGYGGNRLGGYGLSGQGNYGFGHPFRSGGRHGLYGGGYGHGVFGHLGYGQGLYGLGGYGRGRYGHGKKKEAYEDMKGKKSRRRAYSRLAKYLRRAYSPYTLQGLYFPNSHQYGYGGYGYSNNFGNNYGGYNPTYGNIQTGYGGYSQGYAPQSYGQPQTYSQPQNYQHQAYGQPQANGQQEAYRQPQSYGSQPYGHQSYGQTHNAPHEIQQTYEAPTTTYTKPIYHTQSYAPKQTSQPSYNIPTAYDASTYPKQTYEASTYPTQTYKAQTYSNKPYEAQQYEKAYQHHPQPYEATYPAQSYDGQQGYVHPHAHEEPAPVVPAS